MTTDMHPQVMAMPRVRFVCGVNHMRAGMWGMVWEIGFHWDADPWPRLGALIYRKWFVFRIHLDRR